MESLIGAYKPETWGTVAEWAAAGVALLAAGGTLWALALSRSLLRKEGEQLEIARAETARLAEDRRQQQASQITTWIETIDDVGASARFGHRRTYTAVIVGNASTSPIYGVKVLIAFAEDVRSDGPPTRVQATIDFGIVPPTRDIPRSLMAAVELPDGVDTNDLRAAVVFTDSARRRWIRTHDGELLEADSL